MARLKKTRTAKRAPKPTSAGRQPPTGHKRLVINLPEHLHRKLMHLAIDRDTTATAILADYIEGL